MPKLSKKLDMAPYHSRTRIKGHGKSKVNFFMLKNDADRVAFLQKMFSTRGGTTMKTTRGSVRSTRPKPSV